VGVSLQPGGGQDHDIRKRGRDELFFKQYEQHDDWHEHWQFDYKRHYQHRQQFIYALVHPQHKI